jgi:hypothetical protein
MVDINKIMTQKEFYSLRYVDTPDTPLPIGYIDYDYLQKNISNVLQLQGHQIFMKNLFDPHTNYKRLLLYHSTGTGKTLVILTIAQMYINYFKKMRQQPQITIIGFTEDIIVRELMKFPDFGYITKVEQDLLETLRNSKIEKDQLRRRGLKSMIKRRITDKTRGGYYQFYGYQKFANDLIIITPKGLQEKIAHNEIYESEETFCQKITEYSEKGLIQINRQLIESLKYSFIACDEIHNVYNIKAKNNRGMAIQYALDTLEKENPMTSPRVIFASATPLTGSPLEIVDIMNLLIPNLNIKRIDLFEKNGKMRPDTLSRVGKLCTGYVSFLKDTNVKLYPKRITDGETLFNIPYLKFTPCPMSKLQQDTLATIKDIDEIESLLSSGTYTLYDMVFPNPDSDKIGLYNSNKISGSISMASQKWKDQVGIHIEGNYITGNFLEYQNIGKYSTKYKTLLDEIFDILDNKDPGKMIVYHYYVSTSGVMLLKELLLMNGFLDATSTPLSNTRCSICGMINKNHNKITDHQFKPARVLVVCGDMGADLDRNLAMFNAKNNIYGYEFRVLIGSRVIHEGIDFNCVRYMYVLSLPRDISTLIQLYGRAIRAKSHLWLPTEYRTVTLYNLVSTFKNEKIISPEVLNYKRKMEIYQQIQLIERELRRYAIDNFINYDKMQLPDKPTLDGLPYEPVFTFNKDKIKDQADVTTFRAYGYGNIEVDTLIIYIKRLFMFRPVWTYKDLWIEVRHPSALYKTAYDHSTFDESNFQLALDFLINGTYVELMEEIDTNYNVNVPYINMGSEIRRVIFQDPYFILTSVDELGMPVIDYDSFMRIDSTEVDTEISVSKYVDESITEKNFTNYLKEYIEKYKSNPIMSLVKLNQNFHYTICKYTVEGEFIKNVKELVDLYKDLHILLTGDDFLSKETADSYQITSKEKPIGFMAGDFSYIYAQKKWTKIPTSLFNIPAREENKDVVGYSKQTSLDIDFKIRDSLTSATFKSFKDKRKIQKGMVCGSIKSTRKTKIAKNLGINMTDKKNKDICIFILQKLLNNEYQDRDKKNGLRWFYFFCDPMPKL